MRSKTLLAEIQAYNTDLICLQDVDHFEDWWRPQLSMLGYDIVYKPRTQLKDFHHEGVAIGYKNEKFQLFKTVKLELNNCLDEDTTYGLAFKDNCKTDDVGIILFLQPSDGTLSSAICVGCAMVSDKESNSEVRQGKHVPFIRI